MLSKKFNDIILNIAAGRQKPIFMSEDNFFLVNMDITYKYVSNENIDKVYTNCDMFGDKNYNYKIFSNENVFEFLDHTLIPFNKICIYRFLEHIPPNNVLYFIYQISRVLEIGGIVDVIVPNYKYLAQLIIEEDLDDIKNEEKNIYLTTELLNDKSDPHCSIWTPKRIYYYWELEKRFKVINLDDSYNFDGRPYIRALIERI